MIVQDTCIISREGLLALFLEAAGELAASRLGHLSSPFMESSNDWCRECGISSLGGSEIKHLPSCLVGRVLGLIAELQDPTPTFRESYSIELDPVDRPTFEEMA
jgi:hypothetical protein